ncbi:hypothetical protein AB4Y45_34780 [Paraburkholderia sp. EG287A]|uniref:hypothetical protein n=1 Tax=Paraburkholderia sp. EG287A TaxID=3237012 RepID=UPI0034D24A51
MGINVAMGFRLQTDSFAQALCIVDAFRPWVTEQAEAVIDDFMAQAEAARKTPDADPYMLWQKLRDKFVREKKRRMPAVDTDFSVTLIPTDGAVLGIVYTVHQPWYDAWCQHAGVQSYYYIGSGDQPEEISDEEWSARAKAWSALNYDPVCMQGFSIDLVDPEGPLPKQYRAALKPKNG